MKYQAIITTTFVKRVEVEAESRSEAEKLIRLTKLDDALDDAEINTEIDISEATR